MFFCVMKVDKWLDDKGDYTVGLQLYKDQKGSNKALWRYFDRGPSKAHETKLRYELSKFRKLPVKKNKPAVTFKKPEVKIDDSYFLENMPLEVRPLRSRAQIVYIEMRELKLQLNDLAPQMEDAAMAIQMQIWYRRKENISLWQQIDYFLENKKLLPTPIDDVDSMSPARLLQVKANMHSQITNHKNTVIKNQQLLDVATDIKSIAKYKRAINKSNDLIITKKTILTQIENKIYLNGK